MKYESIRETALIIVTNNASVPLIKSYSPPFMNNKNDPLIAPCHPRGAFIMKMAIVVEIKEIRDFY